MNRSFLNCLPPPLYSPINIKPIGYIKCLLTHQIYFVICTVTINIEYMLVHIILKQIIFHKTLFSVEVLPNMVESVTYIYSINCALKFLGHLPF